MNFLKNLQKTMKAHHLLALLGIVVVIYAMYQYSGQKGRPSDGFNPNKNGAMPSGNGNMQMNARMGVSAANPAGQNEVYSSVTDIKTSSYGLPPSCSRGAISDPADLLPKDTNSQWAQLNPAGSADFKNVNLLKAGYNIGIDTVGSSLRNANLQVRSEPPNPTTVVSPWLNTTIEPDLMRAPLEIGCGPQ
uniref:Minor capsid protein P11 C-terminal conserved region domain-containing protein n=1 Tax=viral metagenome TaxID=1070528 RepID=A0A6C0IJ63_9ZZZZ